MTNDTNKLNEICLRRLSKSLICFIIHLNDYQMATYTFRKGSGAMKIKTISAPVFLFQITSL